MPFDFEYETSRFRSNQFQSADDLSNTTNINDRRGYISSQLRVFTGKVDFTNPLKEKQSVEWGFKASLKAEANAQYQSKSNLGIYERDGFFDLSIGISKQVLAGKGNFKLNLTDIFNTNNFYINSVVGQTAVNRRYDLDNHIATLAFTYRI